MSPMHGNDLNSKPWGVNYATGPKTVRQPFGAPVIGVRATGAPATSPGEVDFGAGPCKLG